MCGKDCNHAKPGSRRAAFEEKKRKILTNLPMGDVLAVHSCLRRLDSGPVKEEGLALYAALVAASQQILDLTTSEELGASVGHSEPERKSRVPRPDDGLEWEEAVSLLPRVFEAGEALIRWNNAKGAPAQVEAASGTSRKAEFYRLWDARDFGGNWRHVCWGPGVNGRDPELVEGQALFDASYEASRAAIDMESVLGEECAPSDDPRWDEGSESLRERARLIEALKAWLARNPRFALTPGKAAAGRTP